MTIYLNDWKNTGIDGMKRDFNIDDPYLEGVEILLASYTYKYYVGDAFVLFLKDGKLYEVNGSHCSCYGLEAKIIMEVQHLNGNQKKHLLKVYLND